MKRANHLLESARAVLIATLLLFGNTAHSDETVSQNPISPAPVLDATQFADASEFGLGLEQLEVSYPPTEAPSSRITVTLANKTDQTIYVLREGRTAGFGLYRYDESKKRLIDLNFDPSPNISRSFTEIEPHASRSISFVVRPQTLSRLRTAPIIIAIHALKGNGQTYKLFKFEERSLKEVN